MLACGQCGRETRLYTHYRAMAFCCVHCGAYHEYNEQRSLKTDQVITRVKEPTFSIGTVFHIGNQDFLLINYLVKEETAYHTSWTEYTLFHPEGGNLTLSESDGHYNLMRPSRFFENVSGVSRNVDFGEKGIFQLYSKYRYKIRHAEGEFLFPISGELPTCNDYVNPPYILTYERGTHEAVWYEGEYVPHLTLKSWLRVPAVLPKREGISPSQPCPDGIGRRSLGRLTAIAIAVLVGIQVLLSAFVNKPTTVSAHRYFPGEQPTQKTYVSPPFEISSDHVAADVILGADVDNNWLEADFSLVNETTGDQYYFGGVAEYYAGIEDGESWSEGSREATITVENLSKGRYHYNIDLTMDPAKPVQRVDVTVIQDVVLSRNLWAAVFCLLIFPVYIYLRRKNFERRQWSNSDYSPYQDNN